VPPFADEFEISLKGPFEFQRKPFFSELSVQFWVFNIFNAFGGGIITGMNLSIMKIVEIEVSRRAFCVQQLLVTL